VLDHTMTAKKCFFIQHKECEFFPCHETKDIENFNCLFCYCPLYVLGKKCGGDFRYIDETVKDCSNCLLPHRRDSHKIINSKIPDILRVMRYMER
jgi:Zn-finger protein